MSTTEPGSRRSLNTIEARRVYDPIIAHLRAVRQAKGLKQEEVDDKIGCAERLVSKWENRIKYPSAYFLLLWCQSLGVTLTIDLTKEEKQCPPT